MSIEKRQFRLIYRRRRKSPRSAVIDSDQNTHHYEQVFQNSHAVQLLIDPDDGRIINANQAATAFYGYPYDTLTAMRIQDINALPEDLFERRMQAALSEKENLLEFRHRLASGEIRNVQSFSSPIDAEGRRLLHCIIIDISAHHEAGQRYHSLFRQSNDAVFILDLNGRHLDANQRASEMLGYTPNEIIGLSYRDIVVPDEKHQSDQVLKRLLAGEKIAPYERLFHRKNGTEVPTEINVELVRDTNDQPLYLMSIVRDITERKRMESTLRYSEERLRMTLQGTRAGTWEWHIPSGKSILNERWAEMVGYTLEELEPISFETWIKLTHPDDLEKSNAALQAHFEGENAFYDCEVRMRHKDGHWVWVRDRGIVTEWDAQGLPVQMFGTHVDITQRKLIEIELQEERDMFVSGPTVIFKWAIATNWPVMYASPNVYEQFGYYPEQFISGEIQYADILHPDDMLSAEEEIGRYLAAERYHFEQEYRIRNAAGEYRWVHDVTTTILGADGHPTYFQGYVRDITERREMQEALAESERKYRLIAENTSDGIVIFDGPTQKVIYASPAFEQQRGREPGETLKISEAGIYNIIHPEDREEVFRRIYEALNKKADTLTYRYRSQHKDGHYFWVEDRTRFHYAADGTYLNAYVISRDISEQIQLEAKLHENLEWLHAFIAQSNDGIMMVDPNGSVVEWNPAIERMTGLVRDEVIGQNILMVEARMQGVNRSEVESYYGSKLREILEGSDVFWYAQPLEKFIYRPDGSQRSLLVIIFPIRTSKGTMIGSIAHDITLRKEAQKREFEIALERERRKLLMTFIQTAAHEFRTPLTLISSNAYLQWRIDDPERRRIKSDDIQAQVRRITRLVDMLLLMTQLENDDALTLVPIDLKTLLESICQRQREVTEHQTSLKCVVDDDLPTVHADWNYLTNAIDQVLDNAFRYTPADGCITVKAGAIDSQVWIEIHNNGSLIPDHILPHIFDTFRREDTAHTTPGFGLGLAIARVIIERHEGQISVESSPERGTRFRMLLPLTTEV